MGNLEWVLIGRGDGRRNTGDRSPKLKAIAIIPEGRRRFGSRSICRPNPPFLKGVGGIIPFLKGGQGDYFSETRNLTGMATRSFARTSLKMTLIMHLRKEKSGAAQPI